MPPVLEERPNGHLLVWVIRCASAAKAPSRSGMKHCLGLALANSLHHLTPNYRRTSIFFSSMLIERPP